MEQQTLIFRLLHSEHPVFAFRCGLLVFIVLGLPSVGTSLQGENWRSSRKRQHYGLRYTASGLSAL